MTTTPGFVGCVGDLSSLALPSLDAVFLDRDGTLNVHGPGYRTVEDFAMLPGAAAAVARFNAAGVPVVLVTNQRGIATGAVTAQQVDDVHALLADELVRVGAHLDALHVCPHDAGTCACRKPSPGLLLQAFADHPRWRPERCLMIGDSDGDAGAAAAAGVPFVRVDPAVGLAAVMPGLLASDRW